MHHKIESLDLSIESISFGLFELKSKPGQRIKQ